MGKLCPLTSVMICDDAGGGRPRGGEFPRSMSDFKPGDEFIPQVQFAPCLQIFRHSAQKPVTCEAGVFECNDGKCQVKTCTARKMCLFPAHSSEG